MSPMRWDMGQGPGLKGPRGETGGRATCRSHLDICSNWYKAIATTHMAWAGEAFISMWTVF